MSHFSLPRWLCWAGLALAVGACHVDGVEQRRDETHRFETLGDTPHIEVLLDDGNIEVEARDQGPVEVIITRRSSAVSAEGAAALLENIDATARLEGDILLIESHTRTGSRFPLSPSMRADVTLRVPEGAVLDLLTHDGDIELRGLQAKVRAETGDGRVRLRGIGGEAHVRAEDGSITGRDLSGAFDVASEDGRIVLEGRFSSLRAVTADGSIRVRAETGLAMTSDWLLRSADGSVELSVGPGFAANVEASTDDGTIDNELTSFEGVEERSWLDGKLGEGGYRVLIDSLDGSITLHSH